MPERQPGRPSEDEFIGAALRFLGDDYRVEPIYVMTGGYSTVRYIRRGAANDRDIIYREVYAEGLPGIRESMRDFAVRQLAAYQKQREH